MNEQHVIMIEESYGSHIDGRHILVTPEWYVSADVGRAYSIQMPQAPVRTYVWGTATETCNCQLSGFVHTKPCC